MISTITLIIRDSSGYLAFHPTPGNGWFFMMAAEPKGFYQCRESFQYALRKWNKRRVIGFVAPRGSVSMELVHEMWMELETRLKLKGRSVFYETAHTNAFAIRLHDWWFENTTRKSAMTLFLRGFSIYHRSNMGFWGFTRHYDLARKTRPALEAFVEGRATPTYSPKLLKVKGGFVGMFQNCPRRTVLKLLKRK